MADLLGSLLPTDYAAPDVQGILGGELLIAWCETGMTPYESCSPAGTLPTVVCRLGSHPATNYCP